VATARTPFLDRLAGGDRDALMQRLRLRTVATGDHLLRQGEPGHDVVVVLSGRVKLVVAVAPDLQVLLGLRGPGDLLGELAALDEGPRTASALALEPGTVGHLAATELRAFLAERPAVAWALMRMLAARLREADIGRIELSTHDALGRVAARLVELGEQHGVPDDGGGMRIELGVTQHDLAAWTGASRPAVARALQAMRRLGWVSTGRRVIVLHDLDALRERCATGR
jgi:CRP-like cAMP-binding protein